MSGLSGALSKLGIGKHKKSRSQSSSTPSSPRQSLDTTPPRVRQSFDASSQPATTPARQRDVSSPTANRVNFRTGESIVVIEKEDARVVDGTGHSRALLDERDRPTLPTTISNVNNPNPNSTSQSKLLPTIPGTPSENVYKEFPLPPTTHISDQPPRLPELPRTEPLHHVDSLDRDDIFRDSEHRPKVVVASSQGLSSSEAKAVEGRKFGHVRAGSVELEGKGGKGSLGGGSPMKKDHRIVDGLDALAAGKSVPGVEIPERRTSKLFPASSSSAATPESPQKVSKSSHRDHLTSVRDPDLTPDNYIANYLATHPNFHQTFLRAKPIVPLSQMNLVPGPSLENQRNELVKDIVSQSKSRRGGRQELSVFGKGVFSAAGMDEKLGSKDTVEVDTQWLKPVVQEHIVRKEHTETTVVIDRHIHKHHIYPKIQPIHDPNPIKLQPRHRIFSPKTQKWHEVIGDAAAIEILGEDVFRNGPKEVRNVRGMALPGFGEVTNMTEEERREHGFNSGVGDDGSGSGRRGGARTLVREGILGGPMGKWNVLGHSPGEKKEEADAAGPQDEKVGYAL